MFRGQESLAPGHWLLGTILEMISKLAGNIRRLVNFVTILAVAGIGIFSALPQSLAASSDVVFTVTLDKGEYVAEEPIDATFVLKNKGKEAVYVNKRFYFGSEEAPRNQKEVYVTITSPSGQKLPYKFSYETGYPKTDYFTLLEPGQEVKAEYPRNLRGNFEFTDPGTYTATAVYQNTFGRELGLDVFQEKLTAEPVKFVIKK